MTAVAEHRKHRRSADGARAAGLPPVPAQLQRISGTEPEPAAEFPADSLREVFLSSARLERLQWEVDSAEEELCASLRKARNAGISTTALAKAAGITIPELETFLQRAPWETEASDPPFSIFGL
jgi:hypothetical protein